RLSRVVKAKVASRRAWQSNSVSLDPFLPASAIGYLAAVFDSAWLRAPGPFPGEARLPAGFARVRHLICADLDSGMEFDSRLCARLVFRSVRLAISIRDWNDDRS